MTNVSLTIKTALGIPRSLAVTVEDDMGEPGTEPQSRVISLGRRKEPRTNDVLAMELVMGNYSP